MENNLNIKINKKTGNEMFLFNGKNIDKKLIDFWSWNSSDLLNNAMRGKLAEYIIAVALGLDKGFRIEWDEYDLVYKNLKIEIKSSAYIQSWEQEKFSKIIFNIKPTINDKGVYKRQSDIYIFSLLSCKNSKKINPLHLEQWEFYVIDTKILDEKLGLQKTIGLNGLLKLNPIKTDFFNLRNIVEKFIK